MSAEDRDIAGEYVLGTLPHADRIAFSARLKTDPALESLVADWEARLADLNDDYAPAEAPDLLPAIEARLFPKPARRWPLWLGGLLAAAAVMVGALYLPPILSPVAPTVIAELGLIGNHDERTADRRQAGMRTDDLQSRPDDFR